MRSLAAQNGREIRQKLKELGVSTKHIRYDSSDYYISLSLDLRLRTLLESSAVTDRTSDDYSTSVSHILSTPDGERTIIMAPASTSQLDSDKMGHEFKDVVRGARMVTTEISQVPLSGVRYLVEAARSQGIPSLLDVDVPPQVALTSARLGRRPLGMGGVDIKVHAMTVFVGWSVCAGSKEDLIRCVTQASVLKLTRSAAGRSSSHIQFTAWGHTLVFHTNPPREHAGFYHDYPPPT